MKTRRNDHWQPMWLSEHGRVLYAAWHPARVAEGDSAGIGVVLVPALLHELQRGRRLQTQIAERLASNGVGCLRFDFYGTGDSEGEGGQADFDTMCADLDLAISFLRQRQGIAQVCLLAIRGGALVVGEWLARGGRADAVALWEPIIDGGAWLEELRHDDAQELHSSGRYPGRHGAPAPSSPDQLMGLEVSPAFLRQLQGARYRAGHRQAPLAVLRAQAGLGDIAPHQRFELPADTAAFVGTRMDGAMFVTPHLQPVIDALAHALRASLALPTGMEAIA